MGENQNKPQHSAAEKRKTVILLDWDGTCISPLYEIKIYNAVLDYMHQAFPADYPNPLPHMREDVVYRGHARAFFESLLKPSHLDIAETKAMALRRTMEESGLQMEWLPGAKETLEALAKRDDVVLAVTSNQYHDSLKKQIKQMGADKFIKIVEGHTPKTDDYKPKTTILRRALEKAKASPGNDVVIMLGDTKYDFQTRNDMRDYAHFFSVLFSDAELPSILPKLTQEEHALAICNGTQAPYVTPTFGFTPDFAGLEKVITGIHQLVAQKSQRFSIEAAEKQLAPSVVAASKFGLIPRGDKRLPEAISYAGLFSQVANSEVHEGYHIAEKGRTPQGVPVTARVQKEHALPLLETMINKPAFLNGLVDKIRNSQPVLGEEIVLYYPWRHESEPNERNNKNSVPIIFAHLLEEALNKAVNSDPALQNLKLHIVSAPLFHKTKNARKNLDPFEKLAARSHFELPEAKGKKVFILDDDALSGMSLAEMYHTMNRARANVIGMAVTTAYDGAQHLRLKPQVKKALIQAIHDNTKDHEALEDFRYVLKTIGYSQGIESMTNMEAMMLITRLYEPAKAEEVIKQLWDTFNDQPLAVVSEQMKKLGFEIWPNLLGEQGANESVTEHVLLRSARLGKIDFYDGLNSLVNEAGRRGQGLLDSPQQHKGK